MVQRSGTDYREPERSGGPEDAGPTRSGSTPLDKLAGKSGGTEGRRLASFWLGQVIESDDDKGQKRWLKRGSQIERRYRDERNRTDEEGQRRYNALWCNVQILLPALYGKCPVPICERRFKDKDPAGRGAAQILERALRNEIEINGFDEAMQLAVQDYLLPGRGTVWVRYEPEFGEPISIPPDSEMDTSDTGGDIEPDDDSDGEEKLRETGDRIVRESCPIDFIQWTDFYTFPVRARTWSEVTAIGKRVYMTRDQMIRRFGPDIGRAIPLQKDDRHMRRQEDTQQGHEVEQKGQIYEVWDRTHEEVLWIAEGYPYLCDKKDDPLKLEKFFPVPRPLYANPTSNTLVPVPDFLQYQDQAIQIDELTQRISMLAKACKVAGVYNAAAKSIQRLFNESVENELIPVDDWQAFADKNGVEGNISLLPLKEIMGVLQELQQVRDMAIQDMDRITGINDVMRGTDDQRETLGGQRLAANATGTRLQRRQNEVARFAKDTIRIVADIMCQHFSPQSLIEVSGALYEEGLGTMDMPDLTMLNSPSPPSPGGAGSPPPSAPQVTSAPPSGPPGPGGASFSPPQLQSSAGGVPPGGGPSNPGAGQGQAPPPMPQWAQQLDMPPEQRAMMDKIQGLYRIKRALDLLRDEKMRGFRVDIEVDSTIFGDQQQDKQDRTAFLAAVTQYMEQFVQIGSVLPEAAPLLGKFLQFGVRGFPIGRDLEQAVEDFADSSLVTMKQKMQQASQQPNPDMLRAQAAMITAQSGAQANQMKASSEQQKQQIEGRKADADIQAAQLQFQSDQQQAAAEVQRQAIENEGERQNAQADVAQKQMDMQMKHVELQIKLLELQMKKEESQAKIQIAHQNMATEQVKASASSQQAQMGLQKTHLDMQAAQQDHAQSAEQHQMDMKASKEQHKQTMQQQKVSHGQDMKSAKVSHEHDKEKGELDIKKAKAAANKLKPKGK